MLSSTIDDKGDIDRVIERFLKKLNGCIAANFNKRRVKADKMHKEDNLYDKMRKLKGMTDTESKAELSKVVEAIAVANNSNFNKLKEELDKLKNSEGKINSKQLWKLKKSLCPNTKDAPCAMKDKSGNLITSEKALHNRALEVYSDRLEGNVI